MSEKLESLEQKIKRLQKQKRDLVKQKKQQELIDFKEKYIELAEVLETASNNDQEKLQEIIKEIIEKYKIEEEIED